MKKIRLRKTGDIYVTREDSVYCDFCGEEKKNVSTSDFDDRKDGDNRKCEMQICDDCIKQLAKLIK